MTVGSLEVTPGFGTRIATQVKGGAHHQAVAIYKDRARVTVVPNISASAYSDGQLIGGEMSFQNVSRFPGDYVSLENVQILLRGDTSVPADVDLILYPSALATPPENGGALVMTDAEALLVAGIVRISGSEFVMFGNNRLATKACPSIILQCPSAESGIRGVLVARGSIAPKAVDSIAVHLIFERA
jgi:hypothetical protein